MKQVVVGADIYLRGRTLPFGFVEIEDGRVTRIGDASAYTVEKGVQLIEGENLNLSPGWIDLQVNGAGNVLFEDATSDADIESIGRELLKAGTTRWFGTLVSVPYKKLDRLLNLISAAIGKYGLKGIHVEGPWLNEEYRGCHPKKRLRSASRPHVEFVEAVARICPVLVTLAPEVVASEDIDDLARQPNVTIFAGHTDASWVNDQTVSAMGVTHLMNAMPPSKAREPGICGWLISDRQRKASIICDGAHVHPQMVALLKRAAWPEQLFLVSDMMPADAAVANQVEFLLDARIDETLALRTSEGRLAGSRGTIGDGLRFLVQNVGVPMAEALRMATQYPAEVIGSEAAEIAVGMQADYVMFDNQFHVRSAWRAP